MTYTYRQLNRYSYNYTVIEQLRPGERLIYLEGSDSIIYLAERAVPFHSRLRTHNRKKS